jgi:hypothetical protein
MFEPTEQEEFYEGASRAGRNLIILRPSGIWSDFYFPTLEMAQAFALKMNKWMAMRPDPNNYDAFLEETAFVDTSWERLRDILDNTMKPELMFLDAVA